MEQEASAGESQPAGAARIRKYTSLREGARRNRSLDLGWRIAVTVVGGMVTLAGFAMLVLPGPGWAAIFIGLAILATEYRWAGRWLAKAKDLYTAAKERAMDPRVRRRNQGLFAVASVAVALGGWAYVEQFGLPSIAQAVLSKF